MPREILIVDDNAINRRLLKNTLCREYEIFEAADGTEALALITRHCTTLSAVLLDIVMPGMDGYEVLRSIRENDQLRQIPVIMVTGSEDEASRVKALSYGANDFILKPFNPEIVKHCLKNNIALRETASILNAIQKDKLTGLYNREAFFEKITGLIAENPPGHYILSCFDVDNFKLINDRYGAVEGDRILREIGRVVNEDMEKVGGVAGRISADNFAVLLPYADKDLSITRIIRMNRMAFSDKQSIVFSVGRYIVTDLTLPASAIYDRAYIAKQSVKGRYDVHIAYFDDAMLERLVRDQQIVADMDTAITERQFEVWFQPQRNHTTGVLVGAEALVRWRHPQNGLIPPNEFIPVFEQNGFIYELDKYVWEETCRCLRKWIDEGRDTLPVSVNISRYDVYRTDLIETLTGLIERYELPVGLLRLEITESAFAQSIEQIVGIVKQLVDLGFTVEIDDFGSGYSSLNTLKNVPAQILKIDMRFLEADDGSGRGGSILESIVRMAKWLGMSVIAEGVEEKAQADYLASVGCSYIQGYLYARPMPLKDYEAYARDVHKEEWRLSMDSVALPDNNAFWDPKSMDTLIFNSYVGAACIFEYYHRNIELLRVNDKFRAILGSAITVEDTLKLDWIACLAPESLSLVREILQKSYETGEEYANEYVFLNIPGAPSRIYLRATMRVIATAGERMLVYCTSENITAQRTAEQNEKRTAEQLRVMMNDMPGGFMRMRLFDDGDVRPVYFNEGFLRLVNMNAETLRARYAGNPLFGVHPDDVPLIKEFTARLLANGEAQCARYRLLCGSGGYITLSIFGRVTTDTRGEQYLNIYYSDATEQVREENTQKELLDNLPGGAALYEYDNGVLNVIHLNKRFWELAGKAPVDYANRPPMSMVHPEDRALIERGIRSAIEHNRDVICNIRLRNETDSYHPFHLVARILPSGNGKYAIYATFAPIADDAAAYEQMLPLLLDAMMNATSDYAFAKDRSLHYISASRAFLNLVGCKSESDLLGKTDPDLFEPTLAAQYRSDDQTVLNGDAIIDKVEVLPSSDGALRYVAMSKYPLRDATGDVIGLYGAGRDVTHAVAQDSQFRLINDSIPGGLATYICAEDDPSPERIRITYFNDGFCRLFGFSREEYESRATADPVSMVFQEDRHIIETHGRKLIKYGTPMDCLYRAHIKGGGYKWISHRAVVADRRDGKVIINAILQDVTEQRELIEQLRISEEESNLAVRLGGNTICRYSIADRTMTTSTEVAAAFSLPETITDVPYEPVRLGLIAPESAEAYIAFFESILHGAEAASVTFRQRYFNDWRWLEAKSRLIFSDEGKPVKAVIAFSDVTERLERESIYKKWQQSFEDRAPETYSLFRCNLNNDASRAMAEGMLLSFNFNEAGADFNARAKAYIDQRVFADDRDSYAVFANSDTMLASYYRGKRSDTLEYRELLPEGGYRWLRLTVDLVECAGSTEIEAYLMYEDIDEAKRAALQTKALSETDPLTGLLNRGAFAAAVDRIVRSSKPNVRHAMLMLDIDGFKQVNDVFGHGAGDQALIDIANALCDCTRRDDLVARLGGDEFVVFLTDIRDEHAVETKAKQVCSLMRRSFSMEVQISGSVGISVVPRDGMCFETLYKKADAALYYVKGSGKNGCAFYGEEMQNQHLEPESDAFLSDGTTQVEKKRRMLIVDDSTIDNALLQAIFRDEFLIEMAKDGQNALIRLRHYGSAISVVLLDLMMPDMDGFAVLEKMQESAEMRGIPVIIVSGDESRETCLEAIRHGAMDFITKPVDPELLRIRVRSAVSRAENERLRAKNALLELQNKERIRTESVLDSASFTLVELNLLTGAFTYYPTISRYLAGTYDERAFWSILLSDHVSDAQTVQDMQRWIQQFAEESEQTNTSRVVPLKTPQGETHRFRMSVCRLDNESRLTQTLIITFVDLDLDAC